MKLNSARLNSIAITLEAIDKIEEALKWYKEDLPGPAYMTVNPPGSAVSKSVAIQFEREHFRSFMEFRKAELIRNLEERFDGFEYDPDADWFGDRKT